MEDFNIVLENRDSIIENAEDIELDAWRILKETMYDIQILANNSTPLPYSEKIGIWLLLRYEY